MNPASIHFICAHPMIISWIIAAIGINSLLVSAISQQVSIRWIFSDALSFALFLLAAISSTLLGYFAGAFFIWPFARPLCTRINGGPFAPGDRVLVLAGPHRELVATVHKKTMGQGGWALAELTLPAKTIRANSEIVEEYLLLKKRTSRL
ncbi:MAG: KOW motif-containing protein [Terrimicrobiaceae bacterium]|nr:KOW motif-containing protein [Terrimicrobiaceae bacterium]